MLIAMLLLALASSAPDQDKENASSRPPGRGDMVVAKGCLRGSVLENADLGSRDGGSRYNDLMTYRLTGDKKTMEVIRKEHNGHADVITGELKSDLPASTEVRGRKVGNTRITIGVGVSRGMGPEPPPPMPVLKLSSIEHTGVNCR